MRKNNADIMARLRFATAAAHAYLEELSFAENIKSQQLNFQQYRLLILGQLIAFHGVEQAISHFLRRCPDCTLANFFWPKTPLLLEDALQIGWTETHQHHLAAFPVINTLAQALGCLYVLEGSALGARFIYQHLQKTPSLAKGAPFLFYQKCSQSVPRRWKEFIFQAESNLLAENDIAEALDSAKATFAYFIAGFRWAHKQSFAATAGES